MGCVYIIEGGERFKIGMTGGQAQDRMRHLQIASPVPLRLAHEIPTDNPRSLELSLHQKFAAKRVHGEWFTLSNEDLDWLRSDSVKLIDIAQIPTRLAGSRRAEPGSVRLTVLPKSLTLAECQYWSGFYSHRAEHLQGECGMKALLTVALAEGFKSWQFTKKLQVVGAIHACHMFDAVEKLNAA